MKLVHSLLILLCTLLCSCVTDKEPEMKSNIAVGDSLPHFEATTLSGTVVTTDSLYGRKSVIILFSLSCSDCRRELPLMQRVYEKCGSAVNWLCIGRETPAEEVSIYWEENSLTMPVSPQSGREIYSLFAESGVPRIYISDPQLRVTHVFSENLPSPEDLLSLLLN